MEAHQPFLDLLAGVFLGISVVEYFPDFNFFHLIIQRDKIGQPQILYNKTLCIPYRIYLLCLISRYLSHQLLKNRLRKEHQAEECTKELPHPSLATC